MRREFRDEILEMDGELMKQAKYIFLMGAILAGCTNSVSSDWSVPVTCRVPLVDIAAAPETLHQEGMRFVWLDRPGARPVVAPKAVCVETDTVTNGFAVLTLKDNKYKRPATFSFTNRWDRVMRFETKLPDGLECQFESLQLVADKPLRSFGGKVTSIVAESERTHADACEVDVDTGNWLRILHDGDAAPALTLRNMSETALSWRGEAVLEDAFGRQIKVPIDVRAASKETVRVTVPWPLPARGWWRVMATISGADGSKATSETSLAWIDRHGVTPPLAEGRFRMGLQWHNNMLTERQISRTLDAVVACGAKMVRTSICNRRSIERKDGSCDWSRSDRIIKAIRSRGLAIDANVWGNPDWAAYADLSNVCKEIEHPLVKGREGWARQVCIPTDLKRCEDFYTRLAERYGEDIAYYEIGNEWDLYNFYPGTTEDGIEILKTCYRGIKRGNPKCIITACGWALPDAGGRDHRLAARFVNYGIQDRVSTEAKGFYDVHAVHMHGGFESYRERVLDKFLPNRRRLGVTVPWFANETAVSSVNGNEVEAAKDVWKKILFAWSHGSRDYIWYNLRATGWEKADSEQGYGIITPDFKPRPAYAAFSAVTMFHGLDFDAILRSDKDGMEVYRFKDGSSRAHEIVLSGWHNARTYEGRCQVATDAEKAIAMDMMGNKTSLKVADGGILWPISNFPSALILKGATHAELEKSVDAEASAVPSLVLTSDASTKRAPDFVADQAFQVRCPYDANPATADRTWKGVDDCSFKAWLSKGGGGLRVVVAVKDDKVVCDEASGGDCLKVLARVGGKRSESVFPAARGRREGDSLIYNVMLPGPMPETVAVKVEDDDGMGFDLSIGTEETVLMQAAKTMTVGDCSGDAIQNAIDMLAKAGGGKVVVPAGNYPIANIRLRSGIELHLEKGAVLCGSTDSRQFIAFPRRKDVTMTEMGPGLIQAWNEHDIAITGEGVINANGSAYFDTSSADLWGRFYHPYDGIRPMIVQLCRCRNVRMSGTSFLNSPFWTMRIRLCENIDIDGINVANDLRFINADGIDLDACRHVRMRRSKFFTGDDSIVLRAIREPDSVEPAILEDVQIDDCDLESACQTIRVGCPSDDTIRNVTIRNIRAKGRNGIFFDYPARYLRETDEGYMDVHDIVFDGYSGEFIDCALQVVVEPGVKLRGVRDITFQDFDVKSATPLRFIGNVHTRPERIMRKNFTLDGKLLPDGEFSVDCTNNNPLMRTDKKAFHAEVHHKRKED